MVGLCPRRSTGGRRVAEVGRTPAAGLVGVVIVTSTLFLSGCAVSPASQSTAWQQGGGQPTADDSVASRPSPTPARGLGPAARLLIPLNELGQGYRDLGTSAGGDGNSSADLHA